MFRDFEQQELAFVSKFKRGELAVEKGATILVEGSHSAHLYTVLSGWGFRYKLLADGRRQILNYSMPGDLIGLQGSLIGRDAAFGRGAVADAALRLRARQPARALPQPSRSRLRHHLDRFARGAHARRAPAQPWRGAPRSSGRPISSPSSSAGPSRSGSMAARTTEIPITQQHVADTLGLSLVHTNKTIRKLMDRKLIQWRDRGCEVIDLDGLMDARRLGGSRRGSPAAGCDRCRQRNSRSISSTPQLMPGTMLRITA